MESTLGIPGGVTDAVPSGTIVMFHGSTIPTGWAICNGQNGTPDLRDRFIVGAGSSYNLGATGGSDTVTLSTNQIPAHSHTITGGSHSHTVSGGSHSHTISGGSHTHSLSGSLSGSILVWFTSGWGNSLGVSGGIKNGYNSGNADLSVSLSGSVGSATPSMTCGNASPGNMTCGNASPSMTASNAGGGGSHENRPPYYALYFIMKL